MMLVTALIVVFKPYGLLFVFVQIVVLSLGVLCVRFR